MMLCALCAVVVNLMTARKLEVAMCRDVLATTTVAIAVAGQPQAQGPRGEPDHAEARRAPGRRVPIPERRAGRARALPGETAGRERG